MSGQDRLWKQRAKKPINNVVLDGRDYSGKSAVKWASRESFSETFVEAYTQGEVEVRVQLRAGHGPADARRYLAMYRRGGNQPALGIAIRGRIIPTPCCDDPIHSLHCDQQMAMLVDVVEVAEFGKSAPYIPSLVRLYLLDDPIDLCASSGEEGHLSQPVLPPLPWWAIMDREARLAARSLPVEHNELVGKMVESTTKVVYTVPEDQLSFWANNGWILPPVEVFSSVIPYLTAEGVGVRPRKGLKDSFQIVSVGFGSTDLVTDPIEGRLLAAFHGLALENDDERTIPYRSAET